MEILQTNKKTAGENEKKYLVIHHTGDDNYLRMKKYLSGDYVEGGRNVSVHYVIGKGGEVAKIGSHDNILWHAGLGKIPNTKKIIDMNKICIGVEVCSKGADFSDIQRKEVSKLIKSVCETEGILKENVIRHADISGYRGKWDIGPNFYTPYSWNEYITTIFMKDTEQEIKDDKIRKTFSSLCSSSWYSASTELRVILERIKEEMERESE